jgi:hypothetical protein
MFWCAARNAADKRSAGREIARPLDAVVEVGLMVSAHDHTSIGKPTPRLSAWSIHRSGGLQASYN